MARGQNAKFRIVKNRDLRNDADDHGHAHSRGDIELGAGYPEADENSSDREQRDEQHREGDAKTFVKKKQKQKNQKDCRDQNDGETAEGDLLLFVKSTEIVEHVVRNHTRTREFAFYFANSRAEVATADARGHRDHAFEPGSDAIHLNVESVARRHDAVFYFNDTANFRNCVGDARWQSPQQLFVVGIKFDFDRLRDTGQVTD